MKSLIRKLLREGLNNTYWDANGSKTTLPELLSATSDIPVKDISVEYLKSHIIPPSDLVRVDKSNPKYPILVLINKYNDIISVIDGNHRLQKAINSGMDAIKGKMIPIDALPSNIKKTFAHMLKEDSQTSMTLYHGSDNQKIYDKFNDNTFFTVNDYIASNYAYNNGGFMYKVKVNINNSLELKGNYHNMETKEPGVYKFEYNLMKKLYGEEGLKYWLNRGFYPSPAYTFNGDFTPIINWAKANGYDSIKFMDESSDKGVRDITYIIFDSNKVEIVDVYDVVDAFETNFTKDFKKLVRESLDSPILSKNEFFKENNIDPEELSYIGSGDFGKAYSIGDGRVLKITNSKSEFNFAKQLVGKDVPALDGFVNFYAANVVDNQYYIIMEELEEDYNIEDLYYQVEELLSNEGLPIQYLHMLDTDELDLDEDVLKFISDMEDINHSYRYLGIEASDIKPDNLGVDKNGKVKAFDIDDRSINERYK